jgi:hypothetical protein
MADGLTYYDRLGSLYERLDATFKGSLDAGAGSLDSNLAAPFQLTRSRVDSLFDRLTRSRTSRFAESMLWTELGRYEAFVEAAFRGGRPTEMEERVCPIRTAFRLQVLSELAEHGRKMDIRYGAQSERLNVVEMFLNEWTTSRAPTGKLRDPSPWEWIARTQTVGFQYNRSTRELEPSFPVVEAGATYYMFNSNAFARRIHHVGLAAAYQRDVKRQRHLVGMMLHVQEFDLGVLCTRACKEHAVVASKNVSLFGKAWTDLRRTLNR